MKVLLERATPLGFFHHCDYDCDHDVGDDDADDDCFD